MYLVKNIKYDLQRPKAFAYRSTAHVLRSGKTWTVLSSVTCCHLEIIINNYEMAYMKQIHTFTYRNYMLPGERLLLAIKSLNYGNYHTTNSAKDTC